MRQGRKDQFGITRAPRIMQLGSETVRQRIVENSNCTFVQGVYFVRGPLGKVLMQVGDLNSPCGIGSIRVTKAVARRLTEALKEFV